MECFKAIIVGVSFQFMPAYKKGYAEVFLSSLISHLTHSDGDKLLKRFKVPLIKSLDLANNVLGFQRRLLCFSALVCERDFGVHDAGTGADS